MPQRFQEAAVPLVITKKAEKLAGRDERGRDDRGRDERARRGRASALNAPHRRVHALAPEHIGELGSVAALTVAVLGLATVILGVALIVMGLTLSGRYTSGEIPPNIGELSQLPIWGGVGVVVLGFVLTAAPVALLADLPRARLGTIVAALLGVLAALGGLYLTVSRPTIDPVIAAALGVVAVLLAVSALILARPGR